jgi:hypothetical protein
MIHSEDIAEFTSVQLSLESLVQRFGPITGIDKFRSDQMEQSRSSMTQNRKRRIEAIRSIVQANSPQIEASSRVNRRVGLLRELTPPRD